MMMGLGKRSAEAEELDKRKEYLEDTGMLNSADGLNKLSSPD